MIFFDTETLSFNGPMVLLQYAEDGGPIVLYPVWERPVKETLNLLRYLASQPVVGFNLAFDWYQVQKLFNMMCLLEQDHGPDSKPEDHIQYLGEVEAEARFGDCIKPVSAMDLMLYARKGPYQMTMKRKPAVLRRVHKKISSLVVEELKLRLADLPDVIGLRIVAKPYNADFDDIKISFHPKGSLKALVVAAGLREPRSLLSDLDMPTPPAEVPWAPFATAISKGPHWVYKRGALTWPARVKDFITFWGYHKAAREYALADVVDTRGLYDHFGKPELGDDDSVLACMMGSIRWHGYSLDLEQIDKILEETYDVVHDYPTGSKQVLTLLKRELTEQELMNLKDREGKVSTKSEIIHGLKDWRKDCDCVTYKKEIRQDDEGNTVIDRVATADKGCSVCSGTGKLQHPVVPVVTGILEARTAKVNRAMLKKLKQAGRFHPSATVTGSLSGRMGGGSLNADGEKITVLNAMGVSKKLRSCFTFADEGAWLEGGDFDAFEISIACRVWDDQTLNMELLTCHACENVATPKEFRESEHCPRCKKKAFRKIHALFAMALYPTLSYEDVTASKGGDPDYYDNAKRSLFGGVMYGGDENTIHNRVGVPLEDAKRGRERFFGRYEGVQAAQDRAFDRFCSMRQEGGIGSKVTWNEPAESVEALTGFRRYFDIENTIVKCLYNLSDKMPREWTKFREIVVRRDREQSIANATRTALLAAAFQLQAACMRAALNHEIQSTGAILNKKLQRRLWDVQPSGVSPWIVAPLNQHDEIMCPTKRKLRDVVDQFLDEAAELVPLIKMDWRKLDSWADK